MSSDGHNAEAASSGTADMNESRLMDVESSLAFMDKALHDLSDVVCRQQAEIDRLTARLSMIAERMGELDEPGGEEDGPVDERPPHY